MKRVPENKKGTNTGISFSCSTCLSYEGSDMRKLKTSFCFICVYLLLLPSNISGELSRFQYDVIELAYTNGFLKGMSIDDETINELLKDKERLNNFTRKAAREYMDTVVELNYDSQKEMEKSKKKKTESSSGSLTF
jgi:hypothetical protein